MMNQKVIEQRARVEASPAVSIYCPLDTRRPGNEHDPIVLAGLRDSAANRLRGLIEDATAQQLVSRLDDAIASVDLRHPTPGAAIFVSPDTTEVIALDSVGDAHLAVGTRFALFGLVTARQREPRARVLVLSQARTRCIDVSGPAAVERLDDGFPVAVEAPTEADTPHRDFPLDEHETDEAVEFVFRAVDQAVTALQRRDPRPLVLFGPERDLAYFDKVTAHHSSVIGRRHGNYERNTVDELVALARPLLEAYRRECNNAACDEVREAIDARAVAGIAEVWEAARSGRGDRLVVEETYAYPARIGADGRLVAADHENAVTLDAVEDTIVELLRHGGEIVVAEPDRLADLGHIALLTRY